MLTACIQALDEAAESHTDDDSLCPTPNHSAELEAHCPRLLHDCDFYFSSNVHLPKIPCSQPLPADEAGKLQTAVNSATHALLSHQAVCWPQLKSKSLEHRGLLGGVAWHM